MHDDNATLIREIAPGVAGFPFAGRRPEMAELCTLAAAGAPWLDCDIIASTGIPIDGEITDLETLQVPADGVPILLAHVELPSLLLGRVESARVEAVAGGAMRLRLAGVLFETPVVRDLAARRKLKTWRASVGYDWRFSQSEFVTDATVNGIRLCSPTRVLRHAVLREVSIAERVSDAMTRTEILDPFDLAGAAAAKLDFTFAASAILNAGLNDETEAEDENEPLIVDEAAGREAEAAAAHGAA